MDLEGERGKLMDLRNTLKHKANTKVLVDGTVYEIDANGIVRDLPDAAAEKLLQNSAWTKDIEIKNPVRPKPVAPKAVLLDENDTPVAGQEPPSVSDEQVAAAVEEHEAEHEDPDSDGNAETEPENEDESEEEEDEEPEEWPDPTEDMDIEYLHSMADAYEVKYNKNLGKEKLIERIREAMYPDE